MAIEIPSLAVDRLPHPDWSPAAAPARFNLPAGTLLAALEATGAPAAVLEPLRAVAQGTGVDILVAPDHGLVQVLIDGRRLPLPVPARDAVLVLLGTAVGAASAPAPIVPAPALPDAFWSARVAAVQAQVQEARTLAADPQVQLEDTPRPDPAVVLSTPLLHGPDADAAAQALARAVDASGLFLEAHAAQWLRGERSLAQIQDEARALPQPTQSATAPGPDNRAAAQLDAVENQWIRLQAQAWPGQALQLEIAADPDRGGAEAHDGVPGGVFQATVSLHLPRLGLLRARIRVLHETIGLQITADDVARLAPDLQDLAAAFSARGLNVAAVDLSPAGRRSAPDPA